MSKNKKSVSIKTTIIKPMVLILFLQMIIIVLTSYLGNTAKELRNNGYNLFEKEGELVKYCINDAFSGLMLSDADYQNINSKLKTADVSSDEVNDAIINVVKDLEKMVTNENIEGVFVVFDKEVTRNSKERSGIYIKKDLTLRVGALKVLKEAKLKANRSWSDTFKMKETDDWSFYDKISSIVKKEVILNYRDYAYWTKPHNMGESDSKSLLYAVPLVDTDANFYGVMGIEVSMESLNKAFNEKYKSNDIKPFIAYENGKELEAISLIPNDKTVCNISIKDKLKGANNIYKASGTPKDNGESVLSALDLNIDSMGKYIRGDKVKVLVTTTEKNLLMMKNTIYKDLFVSMGIALVCGVIISVFTASIVTKPIIRMVNNVKRMNPSKAVKIQRVGITQIDALAASIENLGKSVLDNASKLSQIIDLVNMPIGAFEYYDNSNMVYCTQSFFKVVGISYEENEELFINMEKFKKVLSEITKDRLPNEKNVYRVYRDGKEEYIRVKMLIDNQKTLGVVVDVTEDILKKQKIEFERDHDVLTGLLNRISFKREVMNQMANQKDGKIAAFLMWDLDSLKYMNDTFGHELGDKYIKIAADSINKFTKYGGIAGRIGGDEFTAFIGGFSGKDEIRQIINKVKRDFDAIEIELPDGTKKFMRASMGVSWYPQDSTEYEELNKYADYAMYEVKKTTKGALKEFDIRTFNADYNKYE